MDSVLHTRLLYYEQNSRKILFPQEAENCFRTFLTVIARQREYKAEFHVTSSNSKYANRKIEPPKFLSSSGIRSYKRC